MQRDLPLIKYLNNKLFLKIWEVRGIPLFFRMRKMRLREVGCLAQSDACLESGFLALK
jgi:hypothetical protein